MAAPLMPSPLDYVGRRRFAFYPPIRNIQPNEWILGPSAWSEVQVVNSSTGREIWIPCQYIGAVSDCHGSLLIVGLTKELEHHAGAVEPHIKRIIEMPHADENRANASLDASRPARGPAPVIGIRLEPREDSSMNKALATLGIGALMSRRGPVNRTLQNVACPAALQALA